MNTLNRLLIFIVLNLTLVAQNEAQEMSPEQKAWQEYMTPSSMHKMLANHTGNWKVKITSWMTPDSEPMISEGSSVNKMIMGGRYLQSKHSGTAWEMPMEGMSLEGYDNATKEFTSIWIDNLGTGTSVAKGKYDEVAKTINYIGSMIDPITKNEKKFRETITFNDENSHILKMYSDFNNKEFQSMEIVFRRVIE
jgi:Protein of unknown function (DUF1579)